MNSTTSNGFGYDRTPTKPPGAQHGSLGASFDYLYSVPYVDGDGMYTKEMACRFPVLRVTAKSIWIHPQRYDTWTVNLRWWNGDTDPDNTEWQIDDWEECYIADPPGRIPIAKLSLANPYYHKAAGWTPAGDGLTLALPLKWQAIVAGELETEVRAIPESFKFFGFDRWPDRDELTSSYRRFATKAHPDAGGSKEAFQIVGSQYETACRQFVEAGEEQ